MRIFVLLFILVNSDGSVTWGEFDTYDTLEDCEIAGEVFRPEGNWVCVDAIE